MSLQRNVASGFEEREKKFSGGIKTGKVDTKLVLVGGGKFEIGKWTFVGEN